jgi:hypothetical protein
MLDLDWDIPDDIVSSSDEIELPTKAVQLAGQPTIEQCLAAGAQGVMIPNEVYHALPGISGSNLTLLKESNRHLDKKHLFFANTPALIFGSLVHTFVLEPKEVTDRYVVLPTFEGKVKTGISIEEQKRLFYKSNSEKTVIEKDVFARAERMAANVRAICGDIIAAGIKERSLFVEIDGLILKSRLDIDLEDMGDDYDLKTIMLGNKDFSDSVIEHHIKRFGYHHSAALRNIARRALNKPVRDNYLIFANSSPGHMVRVIKMKRDWIHEAEAEVHNLLEARRDYLTFGTDNSVSEIDDKTASRLREL